MNLSKKKAFIVLLIISIVIFTVNVISFLNGHNWENADFAAYINCAKSIVDGTVTDLVSTDKFMIENSNIDTGTIIGPWGFPLLLSPVYYFWGLNIYAMKVFVNLFFILSLWIVFLLFQDRLDNTQNLLLAACIALNTWFFDFKENVLSDFPFLFFSLFTLYLIRQFVILKKTWTNTAISFSLIGLFIYISYSIRSIGLVLLPTLLVVQFIEHRRSRENSEILSLPQKFNFIPYAVFCIFIALTIFILPESGTFSYFKRLSTLNAEGILFDIKYYSLLPSRFFPFLYLNMTRAYFDYNKFSAVIYALMILVVLFGMVRNIKKDYMYIVYTLFSMFLFLTFSSRQGSRLLIPLFPFFLYFLFKGLAKISFSFELFKNAAPLKISALYLFCAGLIVISLVKIPYKTYQNINFNKTNVIEGPYSADTLELFDYIKGNTNRDDAIIFYKPRSMSLYTGRKSLVLNRWHFKFEQLFDSRAQYIAYDKKNNSLKLSAGNLRDRFMCTFENNSYIFCSLRNNTKT